MSRRCDAAALLERALTSDAARAGLDISIDSASARAWASATFVGSRHRIALSGGDPAAATIWLETLAEAELPLRRHLVADLVVIEQTRDADRFSAILEVLTVEEA